MKKAACLFLLILGSCAQLCAQRASMTRTGILRDKSDNHLLGDVLVRSVPGNQVARSDAKGFFSIAPLSSDTVLLFSLLGYAPVHLKINPGDTNSLQVLLTPKPAAFNEVVITANAVKVCGSPQYWIYDYVFQDNYTLLLTYRNNIKNSTLWVLDSLFKPLKSVPVPYAASGFFTDAFGKTHLLCERVSLQVDLVKSADSLLVYFRENSIDLFNSMLRPIAAQSDACLFYEQYDASRLSVQYDCFNRMTRQRTPLAIVTDTTRKNMHDDEGRRLAALVQLQESGMGSRGIATLIENSEFFASMVLYKEPVAAALKPIGDSLYLFDFYSRQIEVFTTKGRYVRQFLISVPDEKNWARNVLVDEKKQQVYTSFEKNGTLVLKKIDLLSGALSGETKIDNSYAKQVSVHDGWVYFTWHPAESQQTTGVYRVRVD